MASDDLPYTTLSYANGPGGKELDESYQESGSRRNLTEEDTGMMIIVLRRLYYARSSLCREERSAIKSVSVKYYDDYSCVEAGELARAITLCRSQGHSSGDKGGGVCVNAKVR